MEVARLLLDSGAQVNMPADSFESPLTLAACGGHVELAALLIERGANLEEVNDEGYTPLMEAAREGHEEMVALLLAQGEIPWIPLAMERSEGHAVIRGQQGSRADCSEHPNCWGGDEHSPPQPECGQVSNGSFVSQGQILTHRLKRRRKQP